MRTFETPGPVLVSVEIAVGEVVVATHDAPRTEVDVVALRDDEATREAVAQTVVEQRGERIVVEVPKRSGSWFGREPRLRIDVRAPHGTSLEFATASAGVTATGRYGDVRGRTASGTLRIGDVAGDADLKSASGDVEVGTVGGTLDANVVSGDLRVASAARGGTATAVSGRIELGAVTEGEVTVRSVSGDVTVGVTRGSRVHVDVSTVSGDLSSDFELDGTGAEGDGPLVDVRGKTVSGDLRLRRAAAAVTAS